MITSGKLTLFLFVLFSFMFVNNVEGSTDNDRESVDMLLSRLDSMISMQDEYTALKLAHIDEVKKKGKNVRTIDERYWWNRRMYDEYYVFSADSAMIYVDDNLRIARQTGDRDREVEWKINRSFLLAVMGLIKDADEELSSIDLEELPKNLVADYYSQLSYLYSHLNQLSGERSGRIDYGRMSVVYEDSTISRIPKSDPQYFWHKAQASIGNAKQRKQVIGELKAKVDASALDNRQDAMNAYVLARMYEAENDETNRVRYLAKSGMADVAIANRDIASLEELAGILMEKGDIERAYRYINYCQQQALTYPNHVRASTLAKTEAKVHKIYVERLRKQESLLKILLIVLCVVVILLTLFAIYALKSRKNLLESRTALQTMNEDLNKNIAELSSARKEGEETMQKLREANERIKDINEALKEANYVKEECIGATFALSSGYIDRLTDFRKTVSRLVRSNSWKELRELVTGTALSHEDLKDLYSSFDTLFLSIYPDFVKDFNSLLREEEKISVKPGELNTELRIYALVRLGITDSVKIAGVLHCSPQTVYNYRLKMRNKAAVPRENFADLVKSLGKTGHNTI
ncbi:MAG: transcriptional regulator [Muribaculaceae bacterium]|nr:transcriptional regulator [Muribaculaceae bacterium]